MIDCVQAASFITEEEANTVTTKIMGLAPQRERNALSRYVEVRDRVQRAEDSVLRKVDIIQTALQNERQIRFRYFKYIAKRGNHKEYYKTKNGDEYITIHPWKLVSENHCYFLEHFSDNGSPLDHALLPSRFEIVRMENIEVLGEPRKKADMRRHTWARELANEMIDVYKRQVLNSLSWEEANRRSTKSNRWMISLKYSPLQNWALTRIQIFRNCGISTFISSMMKSSRLCQMK